MKLITIKNIYLKKVIPYLSLSLLASLNSLYANSELEERPLANQPANMVGDIHVDLVEIPIDDSSSSPIDHNAAITDLLSEDKVAENIVKTLVVIQEIKEAKSVDEKIDVAIDFAHNVAPTDLEEITLDESSTAAPINHAAITEELTSDDKAVENVLQTIAAIQDIKEAKSADEKIDVAIDFAHNVAPEKMEKIDQAIEHMSDDKHIKRANEVTNLVEILLDESKEKHPNNQNISKASEIVEDIQDILEAKSLADVGKGGVELIEDVKDIIVVNEGWFSKMMRRLNCYCCVSDQEAIEPISTKPASDIVKQAAAPTE